MASTYKFWGNIIQSIITSNYNNNLDKHLLLHNKDPLSYSFKQDLPHLPINVQKYFKEIFKEIFLQHTLDFSYLFIF